MILLIPITVTLLTFDLNSDQKSNIFTDDSDFLTIVTCCLCALIITSALLVYGSFKVTTSTYQSLLDMLSSCLWSRLKKSSRKNKTNRISLSEYQEVRGLMDRRRCDDSCDPTDGTFRCHSRR